MQITTENVLNVIADTEPTDLGSYVIAVPISPYDVSETYEFGYTLSGDYLRLANGSWYWSNGINDAPIIGVGTWMLLGDLSYLPDGETDSTIAPTLWKRVA